MVTQNKPKLSQEDQNFIDTWGQSHQEICKDLNYDLDTSDDLIMIDYWWNDSNGKWYPKHTSMYSKEDISINERLKP